MRLLLLALLAFTSPQDDWLIGAGSVHFTPGARTAWHTHPLGQTIWVTEGVGYCQREGGMIEVIRPGIASTSSPARTTGTGRLRPAS